VAVISVLLAISQLTNIKFPHLVRVEKWRFITLPFGVLYILTLMVLSWNYSNSDGIQTSMLADGIMLAFPLYIGVISIIRTFTGREIEELE
jgi:hypothetical protein